MASSTERDRNPTKNPSDTANGIGLKTEGALAAIITHLDDLSGERPSARLTEGKTDRTKQTIKKILTAARDIFTRDGHAGLSLRKVADHAGIAVGNLTYHFATKNELLDAMLREALADFVEAHLEQFQPDKDAPIDILLNVVEFYVRDARTNYGFFFQLWGFAGSNDEARAKVRELYLPIGRFIFYLVRAANPKLSEDEIRQAVLQIFSLEEGYKLFIGMGPDNASAIRSAEQDIRSLTRRIVQLA